MNKNIDTLVEGGRVVAGGWVGEATVAIDGGTVVALLAPGVRPPGAEWARRIDASGKIAMPGAIDAHVHFASFDEKADTFGGASVAAAFGGVTTVLAYIRGKPGMPAREFLNHFREEGEAESVVDFAMHCRLLSPGPGIATQIDDALEMGVTSFKMFMADRKRGLMWDDYSLFGALEHMGRRGGTFCCHAENGGVIDYLEDRHDAAGTHTPENYPAVRPPEVEAEAVFRALTIAGLARCPLYLVHTSSGEALALARRARAAGQAVRVETCPHYLTMTADEMARQGGLLKMSPPLRSKRDQEDVWSALLDGTVDVVASDHAPWPLENKRLPPERFAEVAFGIPGVETLLPVTYSHGVAGGRIDLPALARLLSEGPARAFGLYPRKGIIAVGADADLVLIDPDREWRVDAADLHSGSGYTPYQGWTLRGKPVMTMVRGEVVVQDGTLRQFPGFGRYLRRSPRRS